MVTKELLTNPPDKEPSSEKYFMSYGLDLKKIEELSLTAKMPTLRSLAKTSFLSKKAISHLIEKKDPQIRKGLSSNQQINLEEILLETIWDQALLAREEVALQNLLQRKDLSGKFLRRAIHSLANEQQKFTNHLFLTLISHQSLSPDVINRILEKESQDDILEALVNWQYLSEKQSLTIINNWQAPMYNLFRPFLRKVHSSKIYKTLYEKTLEEYTQLPDTDIASKLIANHSLSLEDTLYLYDLEQKLCQSHPEENQEIQDLFKKSILENDEFQVAINKVGASFIKLTAEDHFQLLRRAYEHNKKKHLHNPPAI